MYNILHYNKENVHFIYIKTDELDVTLSNLGASIYEIKYNNELMTLTTKNILDFKRPDMFFGKTIGPFVNRIKRGKLTLEKQKFVFTLNHYPNALHGSNRGTFRAKFDYDIVIEDNGVRVNFTLNKPQYFLTVSYFIKDNQVKISYTASAKEDTLASFANHSFYTLGVQQVNGQTLFVDADKFLEVDETLVPLAYMDVTPKLDFRQPKKIGDAVIDNSYQLNTNELYLENENYRLTINTDFTNVHIYTDNFTDYVDCLNTGYYKTRRALAIEPEDDILNRKLLHKDEPYNRNVTLTFTKNEKNL